jgi:hypothetical protein
VPPLYTSAHNYLYTFFCNSLGVPARSNARSPLPLRTPFAQSTV